MLGVFKPVRDLAMAGVVAAGALSTAANSAVAEEPARPAVQVAANVTPQALAARVTTTSKDLSKITTWQAAVKAGILKEEDVHPSYNNPEYSAQVTRITKLIDFAKEKYDLVHNEKELKAIFSGNALSAVVAERYRCFTAGEKPILKQEDFFTLLENLQPKSKETNKDLITGIIVNQFNSTIISKLLSARIEEALSNVYQAQNIPLDSFTIDVLNYTKYAKADYLISSLK